MTKTILTVDDSASMRMLLKTSLTAQGFSIEGANDGVHGLERMKEVRPDLLITDINMPNMDGFGVIESIRRGTVNRRVPILVLTTESGPALKDRARKAGATGWIVKPFDDAELVDVCRQVSGAA